MGLCPAALWLLTVPVFARIEAIPGKEYHLTKQHGPWMIMVASFRSASPDGVVQDGKTPDVIAEQLMLELRQKGIPAYTYRYEPPDEKVKTVDRLGREETREFLSQYRQVCVIAGNYSSIDDPKAQKSLAYIKRFQPQCLAQRGVSWLKTNRRQGPLGGAFLTVNPILTPDEVKSRERDPLLVKLNSGNRYALHENPGQYTLVIATFAGKSMAHLGDSNSPEAEEAFRVDDDLDKASLDAWELTVALRELKTNIDAYVWHDRYQSVVTVGAFDSPNDPAIKRYVQVFGPTPGTDASLVAAQMRSLLGDASRHFALAAGSEGIKFFTIDTAGRSQKEHRLWLFDPQLQLMAVPRLN
jgi:hypothetical protein